MMSQEKIGQNRSNRRTQSYTIYLIVYFTIEKKMSLSSSNSEKFSKISLGTFELSISFYNVGDSKIYAFLKGHIGK